MRNMKYLDLTHTFKPVMPVYPGDPAPELHKTAFIEKDGLVHYELKTGMHAGTHMDAPLHMIAGGKYLSDYGAEKFFGRGVLIDARGQTSIHANLLSTAGLQAGDIVLVMTGMDKKFRDQEYYNNYPEVTKEFAQALIDSGTSIFGLDTPSPDTSPYNVHKILLAKEILIIENLTNLESLINHQNFEIIALPVKLETEAAPCRVVAKLLL